jgi:hypothetical protein
MDTSSSNDENPWESAAAANNNATRTNGGNDNDDGNPSWTQRAFSLDHEQSERRHLQSSPTRRAQAHAHYDAPPSSFLFKLLCILHLLDIIIALSCLVYGAFWKNGQAKQQHKEPILLMVWASLVALRAFFGLTNTKCGWSASGYLALILATAYFIISMICLGMKKKSLESFIYVQPWMVKFLGMHENTIWATFLGLSLWECIRWALVNHYLQQEREQEDHQALLAQGTAAPNTSMTSNAQRRPWWWNKNDSNQGTSISEPLLDNSNNPNWTHTGAGDYHMDDGVGEPTLRRSVWWPWSRNLRDDASVDYASLNEDWASRSEEDPLWWTKEDGEQGTTTTTTTTANNNSNNATTPQGAASSKNPV